MAVNQLGTGGCRTYQRFISMWIAQKFGASTNQAISQLVLLVFWKVRSAKSKQFEGGLQPYAVQLVIT